jgi:hypothetical protein
MVDQTEPHYAKLDLYVNFSKIFIYVIYLLCKGVLYRDEILVILKSIIMK